jgi:hypothetical protein
MPYTLLGAKFPSKRFIGKAGGDRVPGRGRGCFLNALIFKIYFSSLKVITARSPTTVVSFLD